MSTLMELKRSQTLTIQQEMTLFPVREEKKAEIKKKILAKHGISALDYVPTRIQMEWQKRILDEGVTRSNLAELELQIKDEKMVANIAFGGNLGEYRTFKQRIKQENMDRELRLVRSGKHEIFCNEDEVIEFFKAEPVSDDDAKTAHANDHGPILSTHRERGGSKTSFKPRSVIQELYHDLNAKNLTLGFTASELQAELEPTHGIIPKPILMKLAKEMNNSFAEWEAENFSTRGGSLEKKVMEPITKYCKENASDSFETSNIMGEKARKIISVVGPELGKAIGNQIVNSEENKFDEESANAAIAGIAFKVVKATSQVYEQPLEESISYVMKMFQGIMKKK